MDLVVEYRIPSTLQSSKDTDFRHSDITSARLFISLPMHSVHVIMPCFPPFQYTTGKPNRESLLFYCIRYEMLESYILVGWAFRTYLSQKHTTSLLVPDKTPDFPTYHAHPPITQRCSVSCHAVIEQMVQYLTTILKIYKGTFRKTTQPSVAFRSDLLKACLSLTFQQR